ncbi:DUF397 domain-containing protein [Streptomyces sp. NPDC005279]|uniref:DUF397 domain-containing protein n=1 Tax=Streptomyces sp. NPDC005279 TaxID=3364712 RepID=UPI0036B37524
MQSHTPEIPAEAWFKSSYSGASTSECVEAAALAGGTAVRDSKNPLGAQVAFPAHAWTTFIAALQNDRLS